mgnify:FL=1
MRDGPRRFVTNFVYCLLSIAMVLLHMRDEASARASAVPTEAINSNGEMARCDTLVPERNPPTGTRNVESDDLLRLRDFGGVDASEADPAGFAVAPDGRSVAIQVRQADPDTNSYCYGLLIYNLIQPDRSPELVDVGGQFVRNSFTLYGLHGFPTGTPVPLTPRWSADGRWVAFLKRERDVTQLFVASRSNGGGRSLSDAGGDVIDFSWIGPGAHLRYSRSEPPAKLQDATRAEGLSGYRMDDRFWTLADLIPFSRQASERSEHVVTVDGRQLSVDQAISAGIELAAGRLDLARARIDISGGPASRLQVRRSGGNVVCQSELCTRVKAAWLTPHGDEVVFIRREGIASARTAIYRWKIGSYEPNRLLATDDAFLGCDMQVRLVCAREASLRPRDLVEIDWTRGLVRPLIDLNPEWSALRLGTVTRLKWVNKFGIETFGDLVLPPDHQRTAKLPLVVVQYNSRGFLRGGTGDDYPIQAIAAKGFAVLSFNRPLEYQTAMGRSGRQYAKRKAVLEWSDRASVHDALLEGIKRVAEIQPIDLDHIAITGLSDGASTATYALIHSRIFSLALLSSCCEDPAVLETAVGEAYVSHMRENAYPLPSEDYASSWRRVSLAMNAKLVCAKIVIQSADREARLALSSLRALKRYGREVEMFIFPDEYHVKWQPAHRRATYLRSLSELERWSRSARPRCAA